MKTHEVVFWEIVLILASVLVFRGAWMILDFILGKDDMRLWIIELVLGTAAAVTAIHVINKRSKQT